LFREQAGVFELARMAVSPQHQGKGYGNVLMGACLSKLSEIGASRAFIVSNTQLEAAVYLYKKHGFATTKLGQHPEYSRGNIVLERNAFG
jgi:putative acetyltransferase